MSARESNSDAHSQTAHPRLTDEEKSFLYHHGCVVLRNVVPPDLVEAARTATSLYEEDMGDFLMIYSTPYLHASAPIVDLLNKSALMPILQEVMGQFDPPTLAQYLPTPISTEHGMDDFTLLGYKNKDLPYRG